MARIPDSVITQLKRLDLLELIRRSGVELRRVGRNWQGRCPVHNDQEPSLTVTPERGLWQCFGCRKGGSPIDWVMATEGLSFREAAEKLQREYLPETLETLPERPTAATIEEALIPPGLDDEEVERRVVGFYHQQLLESPKALEYLESRGLGSPELIERFRLGFANRQLGLRLPVSQIQAGQDVREQLKRLGFLRDKSGHEHLSGRVVVPILDREGRLQQMYGRAVGRIKGAFPHLYLSRPLDCVFHPEALEQSREVILCEAPLDALTFWANGYRAVTTSFGKGNFPPSLLAAMRERGTRRVLIAYDNDEKSNPAAKAVAQKLLAAGIEAFRVVFPKGMDANEYALKLQPAAKSLDLVLRKAEWMGEGPGPSVLVPSAPEPPTERAAAKGEKQAEPVEGIAESELSPPLAAPSAATAPSHSLVPEAPPRVDVPTEVGAGEVVIAIADRRYRVRGLMQNTSPHILKVNVLATREHAFHADTFDLYSAPKRAAFIKQLALELGIEPALAKKDVAKLFLKLEELQDEAIREALEPKEPVVTMSPDEQDAALRHLEGPGLIERTRAHLTAAGIVGEDTNKLLLYLAATSRKLERPLAVLIQSSSAAGKSALMEGVLQLFPDEEQVAYSAMTGQSLYYMGERDLRHKVLAIAEGEGMERASYALKLLQSEGKVSIASTGKDPQTGKLQTHEYTVEGPSAILTTSTQIDLDEEFENRCVVLTVDESREQTEAIHRFQRESETLAGLHARERRRALRTLHRNVQRLLRPLAVVNPFADRLRYPTTSTRARRDHEKYLALIRAIALLHQHQRKVRRELIAGCEREVIAVEVADVELANRLAAEVLGRTLDELPPQTQKLLVMIREHVLRCVAEQGVEQRDYRITRREIREVTGWGNTQLKMHLRRLEDYEYLLVHRGRRGQSFVYELQWDGEGLEGERFVMGLLDTQRLDYDAEKSGSESNKSGVEAKKSGPSRGQVGPKSGGGRGGENGRNGQSFQPLATIGNGASAKHAVREKTARVVTDPRRTAIARGA